MNEIFQKPDLKGQNPYDFLLSAFTGFPEMSGSNAWWLNEPFALDDAVCSTDGTAFIYFDKKLASNQYKEITGKDKDSVLPFLNPVTNQIGSFSTGLLKIAIEHCHVVEDYDETQCNQCSSPDYDNNPNFFCPSCWSSGYMEVLNGKQKYNLESVIIFKSTHFFAIKLLMLYKAALVLGVETIEFFYSNNKPNSPHYFKVGDVVLILMPMMINGNEKEIVYHIS